MFRSYWERFKQRALVVRSIAEQRDTSASGVELKKCLGAVDLIMLGIGGVIGAGIFVLTGVAAADYAGPAVVLSYALAALAAMVAALCYAEFACDLPVAGGAFNYVALTFGEFAAWVVACDLVLEYTLSAAAVAKGFSGYLAALLGFPLSAVRVTTPTVFEFDILALLIVLVMSAVLAWGMKESAGVNKVVTGTNLLVIVFVLAAGFPHVDPDNYSTFWPPQGLFGVFEGAAVVFFSFIGFDTLSTVAEEVHNPAVNMPIGLIVSLTICTILYMLMCVVITGMVPASEIDRNAPFAKAFSDPRIGWVWAERVVAAGALTGIIITLMVSLMGQARIYVTLARNKLIPSIMAEVHPRTHTPIRATVVTAITAGILALLFDIKFLSNLVSIGTLAVFFMVCTGVLTRRYYQQGSGQPKLPLLWRIGAIAVSAICFSVTFKYKALPASIIFLVIWLAVTISFLLLPVVYVPQKFKVPWLPFLPCFGMLATLHLIGSLGWEAYVRWVVWFVLGSSVYVLYGMHQQDTGALPDPFKVTPEGSDVSFNADSHQPVAAAGLQRDTVTLDNVNLLGQMHLSSAPPAGPRR